MSWKKTRKPPGATTAGGWGYDHQRARTIAMAAFRDGDRCHLCHKPMFRTQRLALDHSIDRKTYRGMVHLRCNSVDGAKRGNARRRQQAMRYSNVW